MTYRIDLSAKLALVLLLWVCAFTLGWQEQAVLCVAVIVLRLTVPSFHPQSERSSRAFSRFLLYSIAVATLVIILNSILIHGGSVAWDVAGVPLYDEGLVFGLKTASRLLLLTYSILLFFISTPLRGLIHFLQQKGLSPTLVLILLLTLHFLDHLPTRIQQIFLAQQARGAPVDGGIVSRSKALLSLLSPLVLSSIVESIDRGTALELRGFLHRPQETTQVRKPDGTGWSLTAVVFLMLSLLLLLQALYRWLVA